MNFNQITLIGRLTQDPEYRLTQNEKKICKIFLAVSRIKAKEGTQQADFIPVTLFNRTAEVCKDFAKKGSLVLISGELRIDNYEKDGTKTSYTYCIANTFKLMEKKSDF